MQNRRNDNRKLLKIKQDKKKNKFAHNICSKLHEAYVRTPKLISRNHLLLLEVLILYILRKKDVILKYLIVMVSRVI